MTEVYKKIGMALAGIALLMGCKGDGTLLDLYPIEPIVNPEVGVLIQDNRIVYAQLDSRQRLSGITDNGIFVTTDRFRSFDFESHPWQAASGLVGFGDGLIVHTPNDGRAISLRYSADNGRTWEVYSKPIATASDPALGSIDVVKLLVLENRYVWLLCQQHGTQQRALLYRVDLEAIGSELLFSKTHAVALAADFSSGENGWLLYAVAGEQADRAQVLKTINGGDDWSEGAILDGIHDPAIEAVNADRLLVYNQAGEAYHSTDGGTSFAPVTIGGGGMRLCRAASDNAVYALLTSGVAKSTDGGQTWAALNAEAQGVDVLGSAMCFYDERRGIVYGDDKLFLTDDGGESWNILVYPYDYVFQ